MYVLPSHRWKHVAVSWIGLSPTLAPATWQPPDRASVDLIVYVFRFASIRARVVSQRGRMDSQYDHIYTYVL